ncbi:hypothetical protein CSB37_00040 [bacterium DOLZORAL124_38_8]|nr:MAG: hypothetical protein CSB37_00040 [bacterium DOLZORAL124_38_8]
MIQNPDIWKEYKQNPLSHSAAHYLMSIRQIEERKGYARLTDISFDLNISAASASQSLKSLLNKNLIKENEDKFFQLTPKGLTLIKAVEKTQKLALKFFTEILGVSPEQAETDACKIEHLLSPETSEKLEQFLNQSNDH